MVEQSDYRLKIIAESGHATYFVRRNDVTSYFGGDETALAFSNLLASDAAEIRFALEDAPSGAVAAKILRTALTARWKNNMALCPKVVELP